MLLLLLLLLHVTTPIDAEAKLGGPADENEHVPMTMSLFRSVLDAVPCNGLLLRHQGGASARLPVWSLSAVMFMPATLCRRRYYLRLGREKTAVDRGKVCLLSSKANV